MLDVWTVVAKKSLWARVAILFAGAGAVRPDPEQVTQMPGMKSARQSGLEGAASATQTKTCFYAKVS